MPSGLMACALGLRLKAMWRKDLVAAVRQGLQRLDQLADGFLSIAEDKLGKLDFTSSKMAVTQAELEGFISDLLKLAPESRRVEWADWTYKVAGKVWHQKQPCPCCSWGASSCLRIPRGDCLFPV